MRFGDAFKPAVSFLFNELEEHKGEELDVIKQGDLTNTDGIRATCPSNANFERHIVLILFSVKWGVARNPDSPTRADRREALKR